MIGIILPVVYSASPRSQNKILCIIVFDPYCADGVTYSNLCELGRAQKKNASLTAKRGECPKKEKLIDCSNQLDPYCGNNGIQYNNKCELEEAQRINTRLRADKGKCAEKVDDEVICVILVDPYCSSDGREFRNSCELAKAQKKYPKLTAKKGKCLK